MEESHRTAPPPESSNPASSLSCTNELTGSAFDASLLTAENFRDTLHRTEYASPDDYARWTNEKHNLYLDILEASFVKQLYESTSLSKCSEQNENNINLAKELPDKMDRVSAQFPVLQDCQLKKINIERDQPTTYTATPSGLATGSELLPTCYTVHNSVGIMTEGSGQNFEDGCEENIGSKRRKTSSGDISSHNLHDQIVPSGKFDSPTIASSNPERDEWASRECLMGNYESFFCPKTDVKSFLKGS